MATFLEIAISDQITFVNRTNSDGTLTLSCRVCRLSNIRQEELEVKYHILSQEHTVKSTVQQLNLDNDYDQYKSASCKLHETRN